MASRIFLSGTSRLLQRRGENDYTPPAPRDHASLHGRSSYDRFRWEFQQIGTRVGGVLILVFGRLAGCPVLTISAVLAGLKL